MDLSYTNPSFADIGVLYDYKLDMAYGADENDFALTKDLRDPQRIKPESLIYAEDTEYGGYIDDIVVDTTQSGQDILIYKGRTWHGLWESRIVCPVTGQDYYTISGEANTCIATLIAKLGLSSLFQAVTDSSGITISSYQFHRYARGYEGLLSMLASADAKPQMRWNGAKMIVSALKRGDYTTDEFDSDHNRFKVSKGYRPVNHLICLGQGDLRERLVIDFYADEKGNVSRKQSITGTKIRQEIYDYSNADEEELLKSGQAKLEELQVSDTCEVTVDPSIDYDIGDLVAARDEDAGIDVTARVSKKIITMTETKMQVSYEVGTVSTSINFSEKGH